ncbi:MAG: type transport system ATP-binding protein [Actinomycetota bacterium]|nr:type transport system ATP-binding protein [Actinomycetota bacterium]
MDYALIESNDLDAGTGVVARGVRRTFGDVVAVDSMDLDVPPGRVTALVGPNGSGKTTLLLVLATLLAPDAGTVTVAGADPRTDPWEVRRRTGWMPDAFGTWETLTCREVLETVAAAYRLPRAGIRARVDELLELVHLADLADRPTQVLSRGQKQRLGLARALVHSPAVLLLDEPASGLDPRSRIELRGIVRDLATAGAAVLVSSHVLAELDTLADRAVFVSGGCTVSVRDLDVASAGPRTWTVRALDAGALERALDALGRVHGDPGVDGAVELELTGDDDAASLLSALVHDDVPVVSLRPSGGVLEQAYLSLTKERQ